MQTEFPRFQVKVSFKDHFSCPAFQSSGVKDVGSDNSRYQIGQESLAMVSPLVGSSFMCQAIFVLLPCVAPSQGKIRAHYLYSIEHSVQSVDAALHL